VTANVEGGEEKKKKPNEARGEKRDKSELSTRNSPTGIGEGRKGQSSRYLVGGSAQKRWKRGAMNSQPQDRIDMLGEGHGGTYLTK